MNPKTKKRSEENTNQGVSYQTFSNSHTLPSNRKFGLVLGIFLFAAGIYAALYLNILGTIIFISLATLFVILALVAPAWLALLNKLWFQLGLLLGRVVNPIILGVIFFIFITPVAIITKLFGRDELLINKRTTSTYWLERKPIGPKPESFKNQF